MSPHIPITRIPLAIKRGAEVERVRFLTLPQARSERRECAR